MSLYVYSPAKERLGEVRGITSLQWLEEYQGTGEAKLACGATAANRALLQAGNLLLNTDRPQLLSLIQSVEVDDDAKTAKLTVRAKMTACRLAERVVYYTESYTHAGQGMRDIAARNLRGLPLDAPALPADFTDTALAGQVSWGSVLDAVEDIAAASGLGFRVAVDAALAESLEVYRGVDRSVSGSPAYVGFFGDDAGNLASIQIKEDVSGCANVAIVCGQGEGSARRMAETDLSAGGARRELYVDARDLAQKITETSADGSTTEKNLTDAEYDALLRARGLAKLAEAAGTLSIKAQLAQTMLLFGRDYELGDILPLRAAKYGVSVKVRVTKVKLVYEKTKTIEATLEVIP